MDAPPVRSTGMGDRRFDAAYRTLTETPDRPTLLRAMRDEEVVHALAAASRKMDAYLANVLAVELLNRQRRQRATHFGAVAGLVAFILLRNALLLRASLLGQSVDAASLGLTLAPLFGALVAGLAVGRVALHRG